MRFLSSGSSRIRHNPVITLVCMHLCWIQNVNAVLSSVSLLQQVSSEKYIPSSLPMSPVETNCEVAHARMTGIEKICDATIAGRKRGTTLVATSRTMRLSLSSTN